MLGVLSGRAEVEQQLERRSQAHEAVQRLSSEMLARSQFHSGYAKHAAPAGEGAAPLTLALCVGDLLSLARLHWRRSAPQRGAAGEALAHRVRVCVWRVRMWAWHEQQRATAARQQRLQRWSNWQHGA